MQAKRRMTQDLKHSSATEGIQHKLVTVMDPICCPKNMFFIQQIMVHMVNTSMYPIINVVNILMTRLSDEFDLSA